MAVVWRGCTALLSLPLLSPEALAYLALGLADVGAYGAALLCARLACWRTHPLRRESARAILGWTLLHAGRPSEALPVLRAAHASGAAALCGLEAGLGLALATEENGDIEGAAEVLRELAAAPGRIAADYVFRALGENALRRGCPFEARRYFMRALREPQDAVPHLSRAGIGRATGDAGNHAAAIRWLRRALACAPPGSEPRLLLALAKELHNSGQYMESANVLCQATQAPGGRRDWEAWELLGRCLHAESRNQEAVRALRRSLRLAPLSNRPRVEGWLARALFGAHLVSDALRAFASAARSPECPPRVLYHYALALREAGGGREEIVSVLEQAVAQSRTTGDREVRRAARNLLAGLDQPSAARRP